MKKILLPALAALCLGGFSLSANAVSTTDAQAIQSTKLSAPSQQLAYRYYYGGARYGYYNGCRSCGFCPRYNACNTGCYRVCKERVVYRSGYWRPAVRHWHRNHMHRGHMYRGHMHRHYR